MGCLSLDGCRRYAFSDSSYEYNGFSDGTGVKNLPTDAGDARNTGSIPESGKFPGEGNGNPLQYSCLENPMREEPGGLESIGLQKVRHD